MTRFPSSRPSPGRARRGTAWLVADLCPSKPSASSRRAQMLQILPRLDLAVAVAAAGLPAPLRLPNPACALYAAEDALHMSVGASTASAPRLRRTGRHRRSVITAPSCGSICKPIRPNSTRLSQLEARMLILDPFVASTASTKCQRRSRPLLATCRPATPPSPRRVLVHHARKAPRHARRTTLRGSSEFHAGAIPISICVATR